MVPARNGRTMSSGQPGLQSESGLHRETVSKNETKLLSAKEGQINYTVLNLDLNY